MFFDISIGRTRSCLHRISARPRSKKCVDGVTFAGLQDIGWQLFSIADNHGHENIYRLLRVVTSRL